VKTSPARTTLVVSVFSAIAVLLGVGATAASAQPAPATKVLGNQHADLSTRMTSANVATVKETWFLPTQGLVTSTPIVWQGSVICSDWSGEVWRVSSGGGEVLWQQHLETPQLAWSWHGFGGTGVIAGTTLVEADVEGDAWGLDAATGKVLWQTSLTDDPYAGNLSDLMYDGTRVYVGMSSVDESLYDADHTFVMSSRGSVIALDPATGTQMWQTYVTQPPNTGGAVWSSFAVDPSLGLLYCTTGNNYTAPATSQTDALLALRTDTGTVAWTQQVTSGDSWPAAGPDVDFGAGPQLFTARGGTTALQLVGAMQKSSVYWAFDRATGTPVWHVKVGALGKDSEGEASIGAGRIFVWANSRQRAGQRPKATVMALDPASGRRIWTRRFAQGMGTASAGFLAHDVYLVGDNGGHLQAYRASDGKVLLKTTTQQNLKAYSSLWAQGRMLFVGVGRGTNAGLEAFRVR
jgi:polyvinyl alcohol dehydrogenase (cytochrome)